MADARFPGGQTIWQWAGALLGKLNITNPSVIAADEAGLVTWANHESGGYNPNRPGGRNNPLNTTEGALGFSGQGGSQGNIKDFATFDQGVAAQAYNLEHTNGAGYDKILDALRAGSEPALFAAVDSSKFGTHGLSGSTGTGSSPTGTGSTSTTGSSTGATLTGVDLNPLNWWGDITGGVKADVAKVGVTLAVLGMGLTLITLGAWKSVSPNVKQAASTVASTAAVAAA